MFFGFFYQVKAEIKKQGGSYLSEAEADVYNQSKGILSPINREENPGAQWKHQL